MSTLQEKYPIVTELLYKLRETNKISFMTPYEILKTLEPYLQKDATSKVYKSKNQKLDNDSRDLEQRL
jgi:hypothetical protein